MDFWDSRFVRVEFPETTLYKVTSETDSSRDSTSWTYNTTRCAPGVITDNNGELLIHEHCSQFWLHAYIHPVLAIFFNRIHNPRPKVHLWACTGVPQVMSPEGRVGCTELTTEYIMPTPVIGNTSRVFIAMEAVRRLYCDESFEMWAKSWMAGRERIPAVDRRCAGWCWHKMKNLLCSELRHNQGILAYAAWQVCEAAALHQKETSIARAQLAYYTASAAMLAALVAHDDGNKTFSMIKIIERMMR